MGHLSPPFVSIIVHSLEALCYYSLLSSLPNFQTYFLQVSVFWIVTDGNLVWKSVSPRSSYVEIIMLNVVASRGGAFGQCLGHKGRVRMNGVNVLRSPPWAACRVLSTMWGYKKFMTPKRDHTWPSNFQTTNLWEIDLCCL